MHCSGYLCTTQPYDRGDKRAHLENMIFTKLLSREQARWNLAGVKFHAPPFPPSSSLAAMWHYLLLSSPPSYPGLTQASKGGSGSKGKKAMLPVVITENKKPPPGHAGAFLKPLHTKSKAGRRRKGTAAGRKPSHTGTAAVTAKKARISREAKGIALRRL